MKRCPECGREYDTSMMFCLDDGRELLYGPAYHEPPTAILSSFRVPPSGGSSAETRTQVVTGLPPEGGTLNKETLNKETLNKNSIAVLPFSNISTEPDNEYFCDGLAEELLTALTKIDGLKVAARASTFSFTGTRACSVPRAVTRKLWPRSGKGRKPTRCLYLSPKIWFRTWSKTVTWTLLSPNANVPSNWIRTTGAFIFVRPPCISKEEKKLKVSRRHQDRWN